MGTTTRVPFGGLLGTGSSGGLGSLLKAAVLGPQVRQDAELKAAQGAAQTDMARAHADKYAQEAAGLQLTNDARREVIDPLLPAHERLSREAFRVTGDTSMERYVKAAELAKKMGLVDDVIADPARAASVGKAYAAIDGKPLYDNVASTGRSLDRFSGSQFLSDPGLAAVFDQVQVSAARENEAQAQSARAAAGASSATAQLRRTQTSAVGQGGGKAPAGYRWTSDLDSGEPKLEAIPGGPADKSGVPAKPPTEGQAKALLFGSRMAIADEILNELDAKGYRLPNLAKQGAEQVPLVGGALGMAANYLASSEEQQVEQAQRDFINAVLRRESGAAIGENEFANARRQYFAEPNNDAHVLAQKRANRRTAIEGMRSEFGDGLNPRFVQTIRDARTTRQGDEKPPAQQGWSIRPKGSQ